MMRTGMVLYLMTLSERRACESVCSFLSCLLTISSARQAHFRSRKRVKDAAGQQVSGESNRQWLCHPARKLLTKWCTANWTDPGPGLHRSSSIHYQQAQAYLQYSLDKKAL